MNGIGCAHYIENTVPTSVEDATILRGVPQKELMQRERVLNAVRIARRGAKAVKIMTIKCTTIGVEPSKICYEICVLAHKCGALKAWEKEEQKRKGGNEE